MHKQRKPIHFLGYDGKIKDAGTEHERLWRTIGRFKTIDLARAAGAQKLTPRYSRD